MSNSFRTEFQNTVDQHPAIGHDSSVFLIGSCFSENIGQKLSSGKFLNLSNPLGITFNPFSVSKQLKLIVNGIVTDESDFFLHDELYKHYDLHGRLAGPDIRKVIATVNERVQRTQDFLKKCDVAIITVGTAWVYVLNETKEVVNNCHKLPANNFSKRLLSVGEAATSLRESISLLRSLNPELKIIGTISPVRHLRDGFEANSLSKAVLRLAINELAKDELTYFPSYEIMQDDLRDYRFYDKDLLHPNAAAIDYIWEKFCEATMTAETRGIQKESESIMQALNHKAFYPTSEKHKAFLSQLNKRIHALNNKAPEIDFSKELKMLKNQLLSE